MNQEESISEWIKLRMCVERVGPKQCMARPYVMYWIGRTLKYIMLTPDEKEAFKAYIEAEMGEFAGWNEVPAGLLPGSRAEIDPGGMYSFDGD